MNQVEIIKEEPQEGGWLFTVKVSEGSSVSEHEVSVEEEYWQKFAGQFASPREFVLESFKFLLERGRRSRSYYGLIYRISKDIFQSMKRQLSNLKKAHYLFDLVATAKYYILFFTF